jgi:hypothetical protein
MLIGSMLIGKSTTALNQKVSFLSTLKVMNPACKVKQRDYNWILRVQASGLQPSCESALLHFRFRDMGLLHSSIQNAYDRF